MHSCINLQCLLILLSYLSFICVISLYLYIDFMSCESVIHGARSLCISCVLDCEVKCICAICSLSVGHSRRHVGGPTNWDIA